MLATRRAAARIRPDGAQPRRPADLGQCLSRRGGDAAGAAVGRRRGDHRTRRRSGAVPGAADAPLRLEGRRLAAAGPGHRGRAPARMRGPGQRRLHRRSGPRGRAAAGGGGLPAGRGAGGRPLRDHQAGGHGRARRSPHLHRPAALRAGRTRPLSAAGCGGRFFRRAPERDRPGPRVGRRRHRTSPARSPESDAGLSRGLHRRGTDFLCRPRRPRARRAGAVRARTPPEADRAGRTWSIAPS